MPRPTDCPMGSPSLLNGDFSENVGRLKDFSWSVIYSTFKEFLFSDGNEKNTTTIAKKMKSPDFWMIVGVVTIFEVLFLIAYIIAVLYILNKLTKNMKVTRTFLTLTHVLIFAAIESWIFSMMFVPLDNLLLVLILLFLCLNGNLVGLGFLRKCFNLLPLTKPKFHCGSLGLIFLAVEVLTFLFFPAVSMNSTDCPSGFSRFFHEITFWLVLLFQLGAYGAINNVLRVLECEEFGIYQDRNLIGRLVKKEGFGWIEHYEEGKGPHSLSDGSSKNRVRPIENYMLKI